MTNDLVKFPGGGLPASAADLAKGLQNVQQNMGPQAGGMPYVKLGKDGIWTYGQEAIEVEEGSEWAVNPYSMQHGWAAWGDGELFGEVMVPMTQTPPAKHELDDYGVEWKTNLAVVLQCVAGEDTGQAVMYKGTSIGMQNAIRNLNASIMDQLTKDQVNIVPVITFETDSYRHKKHGKIYTPELQIVSWVSMETGAPAEKEEPYDPDEAAAAAEADEAADDDQKAPESEPQKPQRSRRRGGSAEKTEKPASDTADEKPTRRRRRRSG